MSEHDIRTGKELLAEEFIKKNPQWHAELEHMVQMKEKAEIRMYIALIEYGLNCGEF